MTFSNQEVIELSNKFHTPYYAYNFSIIYQQFHALKDCWGKHSKIFYSLKANPSLAIIRYLYQLGANIEVCSENEIDFALLVGVNPNHIIFVGPGKDINSLIKAVDIDIHSIICESWQELDLIIELAQNRSKVVNVGVRINPNFTLGGASLKMGGCASQFGIDIEQIDNLHNYVSNPHINIKGLHVYNGTRSLDEQSISINLQRILDLIISLIEQYKLSIEFIDVGGGVGIPCYLEEKPLNCNKLSTLIQPIINDFLKSTNFQIKIFVESGRYLVAPSGVFVSQVNYIKQSKGKNYAVLDGGTNCNQSIIGITSLIKRNFMIHVINQTSDSSDTKEVYNLVGPLCTPGDIIATSVELPVLYPGDLIVVENCGAYGPTASPILFLSHGYPVEVAKYNNNYILLRKRDEFTDLVYKQQNWNNV